MQNELDMKKEQVTALQNTAAVIEVYKKKIADMAVLQQDVQNYQNRIVYLQDEVDLLKQERQNNKNLKECIAVLQTELDSAKNQRQAATSQVNRLEQKLKEVHQERADFEQQLSFERKRIEEMETQIKVLIRKNEDAIANQYAATGNVTMGLTDENHPEVLQEQIKKLKKENALLRQEVENRFDKDKIIMQGKLSDAIREKQELEECNQNIQEQVDKLQNRIAQLSQQQNEQGITISAELKAQKLQELQTEISTLVRERDEYFLKLTKTEL